MDIGEVWELALGTESFWVTGDGIRLMTEGWVIMCQTERACSDGFQTFKKKDMLVEHVFDGARAYMMPGARGREVLTLNITVSGNVWQSNGVWRAYGWPVPHLVITQC